MLLEGQVLLERQLILLRLNLLELYTRFPGSKTVDLFTKTRPAARVASPALSIELTVPVPVLNGIAPGAGI